MRLILLLFLASFCSGCAFPIHQTLSDKPPYSAIESKVIVTTQSCYLVRYEAHPPEEKLPSKDYRYYLTPAVIPETPSSTWPGPKILLPVGSKLQITRIYHVYYLPFLPSYFDTSSHNSVEATIISGPFTGVKIWTIWGDSPQAWRAMFAFEH